MFSSVRRTLAGVAAAAVLALPAAGWCAVSFSGSFNVTGAAFSDPGLELESDRRSGDLGFALDVGQTFEAPLFALWTDETSVNGDDAAGQAIRVNFNFSSFADGAVDGVSSGVSAFRGLVQYGQVVWRDPLVLTFGATRLSVSLVDAVFNSGLFGLDHGAGAGATVMGRFTLLSAPSPSPVPLPAAGLLLLGGLGAGGLALASRRRRGPGALPS